jgi:hypothetical protein
MLMLEMVVGRVGLRLRKVDLKVKDRRRCLLFTFGPCTVGTGGRSLALGKSEG